MPSGALSLPLGLPLGLWACVCLFFVAAECRQSLGPVGGSGRRAGLSDARCWQVRDLTLWPLAVTDFKKDRRLFDLWAALAFWDHVDYQFGFIGHWSEWYFDFVKYAGLADRHRSPALSSPQAAAQPALPSAAASMAPSPAAAIDSCRPANTPPPELDAAGEGGASPAGGGKMSAWAQRAGHQDAAAIKARIVQRKEAGEEEGSGRIVRRLSGLTKRMDSLNASLSSFWSQQNSSSSPGGVGALELPSVRVVYSDSLHVSEAIKEGQDRSIQNTTQMASFTRLLEVRLRLAIPEGRQDLRNTLLSTLGKPPHQNAPS